MTKLQLSYSFLMFWVIAYLPMFSQSEIQRDSSEIEVHHFEKNIQDRYQGDDFNYALNDSGGVNLIQRLFKKFFGFINDIFGIDIDFVDYRTLEYLVYILMAGGSLVLLIKFLRQNAMQKVLTPEDIEIEGFNFVENDITEVNFDRLIKDAVSSNNFRLATRYQYLKCLKFLTEKNSISWSYDKTNSDYLNEIKNAETKILFKRISHIYDYVWYGEFEIDKENFKQNSKDFSKLGLN